MHPFVFAFLICLLAGPVVAEAELSFGAQRSLAVETLDDGYKLGGSAARSFPAPSEPLEERATPRLRLSIPMLMRKTGAVTRKTPFGGFSVTFGETWSRPDIFQLGTSLTRGAATAGINLSYEDGNGDVTGSELFIDYALSKSFSVGLSGHLSDDATLGAEPVPQIGVNAEISGANGAFLQGGITDVDKSTPIFGIALGLKF